MYMMRKKKHTDTQGDTKLTINFFIPFHAFSSFSLSLSLSSFLSLSTASFYRGLPFALRPSPNQLQNLVRTYVNAHNTNNTSTLFSTTNHHQYPESPNSLSPWAPTMMASALFAYDILCFATCPPRICVRTPEINRKKIDNNNKEIPSSLSQAPKRQLAAEREWENRY